MTVLHVPAGPGRRVWVHEGPRLLAGLERGPGLTTHRRDGHLPETWPRSADALADLLEMIDLRGRGGASFPLARKIRTAVDQRRRPVVVVNGAEGEPASAKDSALLLLKPHLVLDGAQIVARALGAIEVHLVVPGERRPVERAAAAAIAERTGSDPVRIRLHRGECRFVAGESSAVLQLISGQAQLPVTSRRPAAVRGTGGRPTVLSNAETYAQVALAVRVGADGYGAIGTLAEPGTRLLTIDGDGARPTVVEVPHGTPLTPLIDLADTDAGGGLLLGGYHGAWLAPEVAGQLAVSAWSTAEAGAAIGAGVLLPLRSGQCPVRRTAAIVAYLGAESANRCGPCRFGLPAFAAAVRDLALGVVDRVDRVVQLADAVEGRGACHHPDGTTRSVRSLLDVFPAEVAAHVRGRCLAADRQVAFDGRLPVGAR